MGLSSSALASTLLVKNKPRVEEMGIRYLLVDAVYPAIWNSSSIKRELIKLVDGEGGKNGEKTRERGKRGERGRSVGGLDLLTNKARSDPTLD